MPAAARVGDKHRCLRSDPVPHRGGEIIGPGSETVLIAEEPAARVGDEVLCTAGTSDVIVTGEPTVTIGGIPAARLGDATDGGHITTGCQTVHIGPHRQLQAFRMAARSGIPFVEKSSRARLAGRDDRR